MATNVTQFPSRADGCRAFHAWLSLHWADHIHGELAGHVFPDWSPTAFNFVDSAMELRGLARDGFLLAAGWWMAAAVTTKGTISPDEFHRLIVSKLPPPDGRPAVAHG